VLFVPARRTRSCPQSVLPGWIVGTGGAVRYRLPADLKGAGDANTDVYGYLLGAVAVDGAIRFKFRQVRESDIPFDLQGYSRKFVHNCFAGNSLAYIPEGPPQPPNCP